MNIEHINISAPLELIEKLKLFYCELFELKVGFRPSSSIKGYWLYFENNPIIHLAVSSNHFKNERQGYLDHIAFQRNGLKEFIGKLEQMQVPYTLDSFIEIGMTQVFFTDPSGLGLEVNFLYESI